jgi:3-oxoacyl-[acyl-carrier-protein] synthase-3
VASGLMQSGTYRHILITCSEAPLAGVDWHEPDVASLFGDGAAAVVVRYRESPAWGVFMQETHSQYLLACRVDGGGHLHMANEYTPENDSFFRFHMDGKILMRAVHKHLPPMFRQIVSCPHVDLARLHVIPHQGAPKALEMVRRWIDVPEERFHRHVADYGNLVAASMPVLLHQCMESGAIRAGSQVMVVGTSAGYSQAAIVFDI